MRSVAVVGAGPAGAACARALADRGHAVVVFDKARGAGGRLANRRVGERRFELGAGHVTFERGAPGVPDVARWDGPFGTWDGSSFAEVPLAPRWVGVPSQNAPIKALLAGIECRLGARVVAIRRDGRPVLRLEDGSEARFDAVVVTAPAPQAAALLADVSPEIAARLGLVAYDPCWVVLAVPERDPFPFAEARLPDGTTWIRESTRPGRPALPAWTVHASAAWSAAHLEATPEEVAAHWRARLQEWAPVAEVQAHRWRYARVQAPLGGACHADGDVVAAGDAYLGSRVEDALLSGRAAAERVG